MIFTEEQVKSLNEYQKNGFMHPFTCGGRRTDEKHLDGEGLLVATVDGWICPYCDYTQDWAHGFMMDWSWKNQDPWNIIQSISSIKPDANIATDWNQWPTSVFPNDPFFPKEKK